MYDRLKKLLSESSVYTLGNILQRSFSIITMPVFTRCMSVSEYGILAIVRTVQDLMAVIYEAGTSASSTRFYYDCKDQEERKKLFSTLLFFTLSFGAVLSVALLAFGEPLWNLVVKDIPYHPYVPITVFTVLMGTTGILPRTLFRVEGRARLFVTINFLQTCCIVGLSMVFVVVYDYGAIGPLVGTLIASVVFFFVYLVCLRKHIVMRFSWQTVKRALAFGLPDSPVRLGNWALKMANQLVLQYQVPLAMVGIYSVGYSVGSIVFELVVNGIHWAVLPFYYQTAGEESESKAKEIFAYVATCNTAVIFFLALFTILAGSELLHFFASSKYAEAEGVVFLIAVSCVFQYLFFIPSRGLYIKKKTLWLPVILFFTVILNVGLSLLLIPKYGIYGAASATGAAYAARSILTFVISQKIYPVPYDYLRIAKSFLCFVLLVAVGRSLPDMHFLLLLGCKAALLALYPVFLYMVGFLARHEIEYLHSSARGFLHKLAFNRSSEKAQTKSVKI